MTGRKQRIYTAVSEYASQQGYPPPPREPGVAWTLKVLK